MTAAREGGAAGTIGQVEQQVAQELDWVLVHPAWMLLDPGAADILRAQVPARARALAWQIWQDEDDRLAAQTVIDLMTALWPRSEPDPEWWHSPLGRLCARSFGHGDSETVTRSVAAAMLGVHPGTVAQLVHRGKLARHPEGGITRASVLQRLARARAVTAPRADAPRRVPRKR